MTRSLLAPRRLLCVGILVGALIAFAHPAPSHAFAWKDTCTADVYNTTGGTARLVFWTPIPPVGNVYVIPVYIATGVPNNQFGMLTYNTGIPLTGGCHGTITYASSLGAVACGYSAPTVGANSFSCGGSPSDLRWVADNDDIYVHVGIPRKPPGADGSLEAPDARSTDDADTTPAASEVRQARRARLSGDDLGDGWTATKSTRRLGPIATAWSTGDELGSCRDDDKSIDVPGTGTSLFSRDDRDGFSGSYVADFGSAARANDVYDDALSRRSVGCLAALIESGVSKAGGSAGADTQIARLDLTDRGQESDAYRITSDARDQAGNAWSGSLDVLGVRKGDQIALVTFASTSDETSAELENAALAGVASGMNGN